MKVDISKIKERYEKRIREAIYSEIAYKEIGKKPYIITCVLILGGVAIVPFHSLIALIPFCLGWAVYGYYDYVCKKKLKEVKERVKVNVNVNITLEGI